MYLASRASGCFRSRAYRFSLLIYQYQTHIVIGVTAKAEDMYSRVEIDAEKGSSLLEEAENEQSNQEQVHMNSQDQDGLSHVGNSFRLCTIF